jgi:hypothetical protein
MLSWQSGLDDTLMPREVHASNRPATGGGRGAWVAGQGATSAYVNRGEHIGQFTVRCGCAFKPAQSSPAGVSAIALGSW